jgi:hypothetical protein
MNVPTSPIIRIEILSASFAFIFAFIVVLLFGPGILCSCSARPSQVTLVMQAAFQIDSLGLPRAVTEISNTNAAESGFRPVWNLTLSRPGSKNSNKSACG